MAVDEHGLRAIILDNHPRCTAHANDILRRMNKADPAVVQLFGPLAASARVAAAIDLDPESWAFLAKAAWALAQEMKEGEKLVLSSR